MTLEEEYVILSYLPLSWRVNIGANIIANISAWKKMEDRRRKMENRDAANIYSLCKALWLSMNQQTQSVTTW